MCGFSLLEVLISLSLILIILLGQHSLQLATFNSATSNLYFSIAINQLENITQKLSSISPSELSIATQEWQRQNKEVLPNGKGKIIGAWPNLQLKISWGLNNIENCNTPKIGLSGCLTTAINF